MSRNPEGESVVGVDEQGMGNLVAEYRDVEEQGPQQRVRERISMAESRNNSVDGPVYIGEEGAHHGRETVQGEKRRYQEFLSVGEVFNAENVQGDRQQQMAFTPH